MKTLTHYRKNNTLVYRDIKKGETITYDLNCQASIDALKIDFKFLKENCNSMITVIEVNKSENLSALDRFISD